MQLAIKLSERATVAAAMQDSRTAAALLSLARLATLRASEEFHLASEAMS